MRRLAEGEEVREEVATKDGEVALAGGLGDLVIGDLGIGGRRGGTAAPRPTRGGGLCSAAPVYGCRAAAALLRASFCTVYSVLHTPSPLVPASERQAMTMEMIASVEAIVDKLANMDEKCYNWRELRV